MNRMMELMSGGTTVLFVSHNIEQIESICQKAVWLEKGNVKLIGSVQDVCGAYKNN